MRRLKKLFSSKKQNVLNVYCTAGYPALESTLPVLRSLQQNGADIIELGMPYSDPLADGPVIQASSAKAIANGMTILRLFDDLRAFRKDISIPVILMGYLNPVLQFGFEKFCREAVACGIDGLIIPDMPVYEFDKTYRQVVEANGLDFIFLVTPDTSDERILQLDERSSGFLYAVSSSSITGSGKDLSGVEAYLSRLRSLPLKNPVLVGFGIKSKKDFDMAASFTNGAIIGSAYINALSKGDDIENATREFMKEFMK
jgi:tryptophan synthase alpha chain